MNSIFKKRSFFYEENIDLIVKLMEQSINLNKPKHVDLLFEKRFEIEEFLNNSYRNDNNKRLETLYNNVILFVLNII